MEDINGLILAAEKERAALQEKLVNLRKTKVNEATEADKLNKLINKSEYKIRLLDKQIYELCEAAIDAALLADSDPSCYWF